MRKDWIYRERYLWAQWTACCSALLLSQSQVRTAFDIKQYEYVYEIFIAQITQGYITCTRFCCAFFYCSKIILGGFWLHKLIYWIHVIHRGSQMAFTHILYDCFNEAKLNNTVKRVSIKSHKTQQTTNRVYISWVVLQTPIAHDHLWHPINGNKRVQYGMAVR